MKNNSLSFTPSENRVRNLWLFFCIFVPLIQSWFSLAFEVFREATPLHLHFGYIGQALVVSLALVVSGTFMYWCYYCAYKKPGTTLLLFLMILSVVGLVGDSFEIVNLNLDSKNSLLTAMNYFLWYIELFLSFKLRNINKKMQKKMVEASPVYANVCLAFSTVTCLEELKQLFAKLNTYEDFDLKCLSIAYEQRRKALQLAK